MLMVILGAGASYDSVPQEDWGSLQKRSEHRPPLAAELFQNRTPFSEALARLPAAAPLIGELRRAISRDEPVEEALQRYRDYAENGDEGTARQLMALRFYINDIIKACSAQWLELSSRVTNQAVLLNIVQRWRVPANEKVLLVTFNYDLMLENACLAALGWSPQNLDDYAFTNPYRIFKPHGSVNWARLARLGENASPERLIQEAPRLEMTDFYAMAGDPANGYSVVPAIAVPTITKSVFECPSDHVEELRRRLPEVDRLLVVGWRAQEQSFLSVLSEHVTARNAQGLVVSAGRSQADETVMRLREALPHCALFPSEASGFSAFLMDETSLINLLEHKL